MPRGYTCIDLPELQRMDLTIFKQRQVSNQNKVFLTAADPWSVKQYHHRYLEQTNTVY